MDDSKQPMIAITDIAIPQGSDEASERHLLRVVLEHGQVRFGPEAFTINEIVRLVDSGLVTAYDRFGEIMGMTAAGHRRLAELDPNYQAPAGLFIADRWNDPEALLSRLAWLLSEHGATEVKRIDPPVPCISEAVTDMILAEDRRIGAPLLRRS